MRRTRKHEELMREMGSRDGSWNPLPPDQHLLPAKHPELQLTQAQLASISWVQWMTVDRMKGCETPQTRTCQTHLDERGDLTLKDMMRGLGWKDLSNASKVVESVEELGFYRRDERRVFHLNANVNLRTARERRKHKTGGLYKPLPDYLDAHIKGLSENERQDFIQGWVAAEQWEDDALAQAKVAIYEQTIQRKQELCRRVGAELKTGGGRPREEAKSGQTKPQIVQLTFVLTPDADGFVQTTDAEPFVPTSAAGSYEPEPEFVRDDASLFSSSDSADSSSEKLASAPAEENELEQAVEEAIGRSRLLLMGGNQRSAGTIGNICNYLKRLREPRDVREIIDILEEKCRFFAQRPKDAAGKAWGWVVGVVRGEVESRVGKPTDLQDQLRAAADAMR